MIISVLKLHYSCIFTFQFSIDRYHVTNHNSKALMLISSVTILLFLPPLSPLSLNKEREHICREFHVNNQKIYICIMWSCIEVKFSWQHPPRPEKKPHQLTLENEFAKMYSFVSVKQSTQRTLLSKEPLGGTAVKADKNERRTFDQLG